MVIAALLALALALALALVPEAEPEVVAVADADADVEVVGEEPEMVALVESMVPQVSRISVVHACWPVRSLGWSAVHVSAAA